MKKAFALLIAAALAVPAVFAQNDPEIQGSVQKSLSGSRFKDIQVSVQGGVVTLSGTVDLVATKLNADQKVRHVKGVGAIRDDIQVNSGAPRPLPNCVRARSTSNCCITPSWHRRRNANGSRGSCTTAWGST